MPPGSVSAVVAQLPHPGHVRPGFTVEPGRCWRLIYSSQLQATHCSEAPTGTGPRRGALAVTLRTVRSGAPDAGSSVALLGETSLGGQTTGGLGVAETGGGRYRGPADRRGCQGEQHQREHCRIDDRVAYSLENGLPTRRAEEPCNRGLGQR